MAKHFAIIANEKGEPLRFPFKPWVREHLSELPPNFPQEGTTHRFKRNLLKLGWKESEGADTVFVIKPDSNNSFEYANDYVEELETEIEELEDENEAAQEVTFTLERDLQRALRQAIQSIELGLEITDGGKERHTVAGFVDITSRDAQGRSVIIELKAPTAKPEVIAQTLAYMEAVQTEDKKEVRGIIVASDFADRVKLAARQIPNLKLIKYSIQFNFDSVE